MTRGHRADPADVIKDLDLDPFQVNKRPNDIVEPAQVGTHASQGHPHLLDQR
jgi:hypothetical protein